MNLILDIKIYISLFDAYTWLKMWHIDDEFKCYASSDQGISVFINTFVTMIKNNFINGYRITPTLSILNIPHSINDIPETTESGHKIWYYMGKEYRNNDLPAIITNRGDQGWYDNGKKHRENDLPAVIYNDGDKYWYYDGELHRKNDLPAEMTSKVKKWYFYGKLHRDNNLPAIIRTDGSQV